MCSWNTAIVQTAVTLEWSVCSFDSFTIFLALLLGGTLLQRIVSQ